MLSVAVAVVHRGGQVLVGRRAAGLPLAGCREFPGGKLQPEESPEAGAIRECLEETGLEVQVTGLYEAVEHEYPHGGVRIWFYACRPIEPCREPHAPYCYVGLEDLRAEDFPAANAGLIARLRGMNRPCGPGAELYT